MYRAGSRQLAGQPAGSRPTRSAAVSGGWAIGRPRLSDSSVCAGRRRPGSRPKPLRSDRSSLPTTLNRGRRPTLSRSEALASPASQLAGADGSQRKPSIMALLIDIAQRPGEQPQRGLVHGREIAGVDHILDVRERRALLHHRLDLFLALVEAVWRAPCHGRASFPGSRGTVLSVQAVVPLGQRWTYHRSTACGTPERA